MTEMKTRTDHARQGSDFALLRLIEQLRRRGVAGGDAQGGFQLADGLGRHRLAGVSPVEQFVPQLVREDLDTDGGSARVALLRTYPGSGGLFGSRSYTQRSTVVLARGDSGWRITVPHDDYLLDLDKH